MTVLARNVSFRPIVVIGVLATLSDVELWKKLGCAAAVMVWLVVSMPFLFAVAWSGAHCEPVPECQSANEWHFGLVIVGVTMLAGLTGFALARALEFIVSRREDEGASAGFFSLAIVATFITAGAVIFAAYAFFASLMT